MKYAKGAKYGEGRSDYEADKGRERKRARATMKYAKGAEYGEGTSERGFEDVIDWDPAHPGGRHPRN